MPLLVNSVPNLAQGVSQQPDNLRYPGQCDEQINAWATVVEGLKKRPNTNYVKNLDTDGTANIFTHFVKRDETNQYAIVVSLGNVSLGIPAGVSAYDVSLGTSIPVTVTSIANSYLSLGTSVTNPLNDLRALTVADYTFLVNKRKTVQKDTNDYSNVPDKEALIVVKLGDYEKLYSVYINDSLIPFSAIHGSSGNPSPDVATYKSGASSDAINADTERIAKDLALEISAEYATTRTGITGISFTLGGSGWLQNLNRWNHRPEAYKKLEFYVRQESPDPSDPSSTFVNKSAKGFCNVSGGVITDFVFTNTGSNYDTDTTTYPVSVEFVQKAEYYGWHVDTQKPGYTATIPTGLTVTVGAFEPLIVEREGSVIRLLKTQLVSNGGNYYLLKEEHTSNADTEPGVGQAWETYWESTTATSGATAWASGTVYDRGADFDVRTSDGLSNQGLQAVYKEVASITDLPKECFNNFVVKVKGDADIDQDDYYVRFTTDNKSKFGQGSWVETVGWQQDESETAVIEGIRTHLDATTMPIVLVVDSYDDQGKIVSFTLKTPQEDEEVEVPDEIGWGSRQAGDDITNPFPTFTGKTINDVFFFKNRLGFVTDTSVIFSEADNYFNFFRTTTQQLLDSAPIDVGLSHTKVAILQHAIPFQEKLMLFSKQSQFVLRGADILSPKTVAISPVTEYDISDSVEPVALGNYIYFTFKRNDFEGMYEYFVDNNTELFDAEEVTQQVPKYIPNNVRKIAGSQQENTICIGVDSDLKTLYVYKYFWSNKEKIQSAWMKFTFDRDVVGFDFIDSKLYMITKDTEGLHLEFLTLEDGLTDEGLGYPLLLDSRVDGSDLTVSYSASTKKSTISGFPYDPVDVEVYSKVGHKYDFTKTTSTAGEVTGDITSVPFFAGVPYNMLYRFSNQAIKQPTERGGRSASDYTFQTIRNGSINYADTGHFVVEVTPEYRDTYKYVFNPDITGANLLLNEFEPQDGHFRFAVQGQPDKVTIEVKSDSALPCKLLAAEFESMVIPRSKRYGS